MAFLKIAVDGAHANNKWGYTIELSETEQWQNNNKISTKKGFFQHHETIIFR